MNVKQWLFAVPFLIVTLPLLIPIAIIFWAAINIVEDEYYSPTRIWRVLQ